MHVILFCHFLLFIFLNVDLIVRQTQRTVKVEETFFLPHISMRSHKVTINLENSQCVFLFFNSSDKRREEEEGDKEEERKGDREEREIQ